MYKQKSIVTPITLLDDAATKYAEHDSKVSAALASIPRGQFSGAPQCSTVCGDNTRSPGVFVATSIVYEEVDDAPAAPPPPVSPEESPAPSKEET